MKSEADQMISVERQCRPRVDGKEISEVSLYIWGGGVGVNAEKATAEQFPPLIEVDGITGNHFGGWLYA